MRVLFVGDIVGKPGRRAVAQLVPPMVQERHIDMVIANCENAAGGFGVTRDVIDELFRGRIDILTSGNHIWDKKEVLEFIEYYPALLRPANYPAGVPGVGSIVSSNGTGGPIAVINLEGRVFMHPLDCPFRTAEREIERFSAATNIIIVDMHAEATSEKQAMGWFLDGRVSAVIGTHTHVQTADERILPKGTGYITDAGMTGAFDSVLGIRKDIAVGKFLSMTPAKFDVAKGDVRLQGVLLDIDDASGKTRAIERVNAEMKN